MRSHKGVVRPKKQTQRWRGKPSKKASPVKRGRSVLKKENKIKVWSNLIRQRRQNRIGRFFESLKLFTKQYRPIIVVISVLLFGGLSLFFYKQYVRADTFKTVTTQAEWEAGEFYNNTVDFTSAADAIQIKSGGVGSWDASTPGSPEDTHGSFSLAAQTAGVGADLTSDGSYIYLEWGNNLPDFWRYNPDTNTWKQLASAPAPFYYNSAITYYNGYVYAITGHDGTTTTDARNEFYRYDVANDTWSKLANAPDSWGTVSGPGGSDIESAGNGKIYAIQGNAQTGFWVYDTTLPTPAWTDLAPIPDPVSASNSHPLIYSGKSFVIAGVTYCSSGCLYTFLGGNTSFYRYDIAGVQWYTSGNAPLTPVVTTGSATTGDAMTEDPTNHIIYALRGGSVEFLKYTVGDGAELVAGAWDLATGTTENTQRNAVAGASLAYINVGGSGYVYALLGGTTPDGPNFGRFDISSGHWDMHLSPVSPSTNADNLILHVPSGVDCSDSTLGCLYVVPANTTAQLRRYNIQTRTWTVPGLPANTVVTGAGATACYDGNGTIFVVRGANQANVYNYNISDGVVTAVNLTTGNAGAGADIACPGANDTAYLLHGNGGVLFSRLVTTTWVAMQTFTGSTPSLPYLNVNYGAAIGTDGTDVYALIGNGRGVFLKYTVGTNNWSEKTNLPSNTSTSGQTYTSTMSYDGLGNLYAIPGHFQKDFWRYNITGNAWTRAADLPVRMARSQGITKGVAGGPMYVLRGETWGGIYQFNPTNNNYTPSATWVSAPVDLGYVSTFMTFSAEETLSGNTITYWTRTSSNKVDWSSWATTTNGGAISSTPARYIQVKVQLNSADGTSTPVLGSFTVNYHEDTADPANPTVTAYSDSTEATPLTNTGSYFYTNPYFKFTSATESESPIAGYYARWTTDASFDPSDPVHNEEYYQTGTTYLVRRPMTRTGSGTIWYMRVATKDLAGNISAPQTRFQYTYTGITNATEKSWASYAAFTGAGTTLSNVTASQSPDVVKLSAVANGAWTNEAPLPFNAAAGASIIYVSANGNFYITQSASRNIYSYSAATKVYTQVANTILPANNFGTGASMVLVNPNGTTCIDTVGCIFITRGGGVNVFSRFNIGGSGGVNYGAGICGAAAATTANTVTACANTGQVVGAGGSLAFDNNDTIYALYGNNSQYFYKYSLSNNTWTLLTNVDNAVGVGGTLSYMPNGPACSANAGCLFATRGQANNTHFYKNEITLNPDTGLYSYNWSYGPNTPTIFGDGASSRRVGNLIYYSRGNYGNDQYTYNPATSTWARIAPSPTNMYQGSEQGWGYNTDNNFLYSIRGYTESSLFAYDLTNNDWDRTPSIPNFYTTTTGGFTAGAVAYNTATSTMYVARGNGFSDFWSYNSSTGLWRQLADVPHTVTTGADAEYIDHANNAYDGVYLLAGAEGLNDNITYFFRYNPDTDVWVQLSYRNGSAAAIPEVAGGADLVYDGTDTLYTTVGGSQLYLKYDIPTNTWIDTSLGTALTYTGAAFNDVTSNFNVGGLANYVAIFDNNTDYVYVGSASKFNGVQFNLSTNGAPSITPLFQYCTAADCGSATAFTPSDGTAGITTSGLVYFDPTSWAAWAPVSVNGTSQYWIRIRRQNATQTTQPQSNTVKVVNNATPATLTTGSCTVKVNVGGTNYLYANRGGGTPTVYRYNLSSPPLVWQQITNAPGNFNNGDTCVLDGPDDGDANIIMPQGAATNMNMFVLNPGANAGAGAWTMSAPKTIGKAFTYNSGTGYADVTTQFNAGGAGNYVDMFGARYDYIYIGSTDRFNLAQFALHRNASTTITPAFGYCTTADCVSATAFTPTDNTVGMTTSGQIGWDYNNWTTWTPVSVNGSAAMYYIRIQRTAVTVTTIPQSDTVVIGNPLMTLNYFLNGSLVQGPANTILGFRGASTSSVDRYVVSTASSGYQQSGTWTSEIVDFNGGNSTGIYNYAGLDVTMTDAASTYETVETRTCGNSACDPTLPGQGVSAYTDANWGEWTAVTNPRTISGVDYYSVGSAIARYGQARIRLTSDQVLTPTISSLHWNYYTDSTPPNNPGVPVSGYTDSGKGTGITNNSWSNDLTPYFEWTSTDDASGIGIDGYYVSFCSEASGGATKDPVTDANDPCNLAYKSGTNYYAASGLTSVGSWNALTQSASALTNGTYYLRIKTKDRNGNTTASAVDAFTFKVDGSNPNNITTLSVYPSSNFQSSSDNFMFRWTAVTDVGPSGVYQYCYHPGGTLVDPLTPPADTCVLASAICTGSTCEIGPIAHYQTRVNTIYVRAVDAAGNDASASPTYASTGYFFTGPAPTAPASVTVSPDSQVDTNAFEVDWTLPATCLGQSPCSASDIQGYCYTFNSSLPSAGTCGTNFTGTATPSPDGGWTTSTQTAGMHLTTFSAALQQGTNTIHVVAKDAVGNIDYLNYTSDSFEFTSNAPGVPVGLSATDSSDRAANRFSVTLTWDVPVDVGSGVEAYKVYRCTADCENPDVSDDPPDNYDSIATVNTLGYLDTSLANTITYTYFIRATGTGGNISGNSALVSIKPEGKFKAAPAMSGNPTTNIRIRSAEISWLTQDDVDKNGNPVAHPASSYVQYGKTTSYGEGEPGTSDLVKEHTVSLTNLSPNTEYHYRLKWVDVDGNVGLSSDYTFTTLGAPSAPTGVTATPASGTTNSFAFSWTKPADEGVVVASYKYSVNSTPTADNTTTTTSTTVAAYAAATRQGANTFYVVAVDDGGNVNYNNYGSADFTAYTTPPNPPQNITLVDSSDRDAKRFLLTLTWDAPAATAAGGAKAQAIDDSTIYYTIYRAIDGVTFSEIATITSTGYLDTGLNSETTYYYKVTARDKAQATSEPTKVVSDKPEGRFTSPPAITKSPVAVPDSFSAVVTWSTERIASSFVDFGTTATDYSKEQGTADLVIDHSVKVTGLKAETTYYFQVKSIDVDENVAYSTVASFTTLEAPRVLDLKIADIRLYDTIISWKTNKETTALISYGTTANYGLTYSDTTGSYSLTHTVKLENLKDSTLYHLRIGGEDRNGNPITSDDYTFSTQTFPKVSDISTKNKSQGQTEVFWKTNVPTTSSVEYYGDSIAPKTQGNTAMVTDHSILLYGLEDASIYKFKAHGADSYGYEAVSAEQEFTTLQDTTPPEVFGVSSESNTIGSGDASKIQIVVSWKTNEPTTSQVEFGVGMSSTDFTDTTEENAELVMEHLTVIAELTPAKTYHFRVVSRDKAGNVTKSNSYTVLTSRKRESFLQLIITNLEETFSWLGNIGSAFGSR